MTRIEEIEARLKESRYVGSDFVAAKDDISYLLAENKRMREALECMSGAFDTPIARRRIDNPTANEARVVCRAALKGIEP